jgi:hypothetical protein
MSLANPVSGIHAAYKASSGEDDRACEREI